MLKWIFSFLALWAACTSAAAQTSKEFAQIAAKSWSELECAALASTAHMKAEQVRLFKSGYEHGKMFLEAVKSGKVETADIRQAVPIGFSFNMQGPSTDFVLGVVWSAAYDDAHEDIYESTDGKPIDSSLWSALAKSKFDKANCEFL